MMRIPFELVPLDEVVPWGEHRRLHWYGLTQGWYGLEVGGIELLRYTEQARALLDENGTAPPWVDYYVVRLWEDMLEAMPVVLEPVPSGLAEFFAVGSESWVVDTDDADVLKNSAIDLACEGRRLRCVDTGYLRFGPVFRWWRTLDPVDRVSVAWQFTADPDGEIAFTAPLSGRASVETSEFVAAVTDFDHRLLRAMQERVDRLTAIGAAPGVELDIAGLAQEQAQRRTWLPRALAQQVDDTDWDAVRAGAAILAPHLT
ncbi:hypothetical protein F6W96_24190 [Nocardia terpenica]|uniref:Uncharacterized protein n=2 Tax=Nocardia terpenica TaxID=455432 RepID=A0A6G9ZFL2_9NOCA|nr:hypothetical protein F6W96_24190 [Nocardia terpenica]